MDGWMTKAPERRPASLDGVGAKHAQLLVKLLEACSEEVVNRVVSTMKEDRHSSMNIILRQEVTSYNKLINYVRQAMSSLKEALAGGNVMSSDVENTFHHVKRNVVLRDFRVRGRH